MQQKKKKTHEKQTFLWKISLPFATYLSTQSSFYFMVASTFSWSS
jgi:hypothetical protein